MTAYPAWTPASRPGIIPLRPLTFGVILGRSFAALRHNPRVLLGFALCVQTAGYLIAMLGIGGVAFASFTRLDTLAPGTDEFDAVMAGSVGITAVTAFVLGLAAGALGVIVQAVVVSEVAHAAVAERLTLRALWQRVKPVAWRLIGYAFLVSLAVVLLFTIVGAAIFAIGTAALPVAIALTFLTILASIPLTLWLSTKLLLVSAAILLEQETIRGGIVRSWTLIRGRFWPALGVIVIIAIVFSAVAQLASIPFSFLAPVLMTIVAPTGGSEDGAIVALAVALVATQIVTLLIQSVAIVVQSTATAIIYIDCRMRREGLDIDLLAYVERRDAGAVGLGDPYRENIGRQIAPRVPAYPMPGYPAGPGYPQPPAYRAYPPQPPAYRAYPPQPPAHDSAPPAPHPPPPATPAAAPAADRWTAPGASSAPVDPESPWS